MPYMPRPCRTTAVQLQEELYDICGLSELVDAALDGYCVTVFAFGQTGSGKTHTIIGPRLSRGAAATATTSRLGSAGSASDEHGGAGGSASGSRGLSATGADGGGGVTMGRGGAAAGPPGGMLVDPEDGILTRAVAAAYQSMEARSAGGGVEFNVSASVVELYNESVTDLLALDKSKTLAVRKDARDGFAVTGLTQVRASRCSAACGKQHVGGSTRGERRAGGAAALARAALRPT